jgi:hypothetical protein
MIKLKHILTEKKELGGALINKIERLTDRNNHNEARKVLAAAMGDKRFAKAYAGMEEISIALGYLPPELGKLRNRLDKKLFIQAKKTYSDYEQIHGAF